MNSRIKYIFGLLVLLAISAAAFPHQNDELIASKTATEIAQKGTWTGEVVDLSCFAQTGKVNSSYKLCAEKQVKNGQPMGLLKEGKIQGVLVADPDKMKAYEKVISQGVVFEVETTFKGEITSSKGLNIIIVTQAM